jgi:hypothetical protein
VYDYTVQNGLISVTERRWVGLGSVEEQPAHECRSSDTLLLLNASVWRERLKTADTDILKLTHLFSTNVQAVGKLSY